MMSASPHSTWDVLVVGAGAAGLATAASLLKRRPSLRIAVLDPAQTHSYQPGWTMVGAGIFEQKKTVRTMAEVIPKGVIWIAQSVIAFHPTTQQVVLSNDQILHYEVLVAAPGLKLNWSAIAGLSDTLGQHGVTSNYRADLAPYTWKLVQNLHTGRALFTQPPMPIKCAGAPQKAMYLSADYWLRAGHLAGIDVQFHTAGGVLFSVADYVPALMEYVERYNAKLNFGSTLVAVDGPARQATFAHKNAEGHVVESVEHFDMIHVCPPQGPLDVIKHSPLANPEGWIDVDQHTLRHQRYSDVFALGDSTSTPNAKTAAAARKQAPVVAENVLATLDGRALPAQYDGYGSCPLTVERGKIVLAEFGYGARLMPSLPAWILDGRRPSRLAWHLKADVLPALYWNAMLKGHEILCKP